MLKIVEKIALSKFRKIKHVSYTEITLITISLLVLFTGCRKEQIQPDWLKSWLNNPTCMPPCFENFTPGITTIDEAESILRSSPGVQIYSFPERYGSERLELGWTILGSSDSGMIFSEKVPHPYRPDPLRIEKIHINVYSDLYIKDLLSAYGDPDYVRVFDCRGEFLDNFCSLDLIYENSGLVIGLFLKSDFKRERIDLHPNSRVSNLEFLRPGLNNYFDAPTIKSGSIEDLDEWKGFGIYYNIDG